MIDDIVFKKWHDIISHWYYQWFMTTLWFMGTPSRYAYYKRLWTTAWIRGARDIKEFLRFVKYQFYNRFGASAAQPSGRPIDKASSTPVELTVYNRAVRAKLINRRESRDTDAKTEHTSYRVRTVAVSGERCFHRRSAFQPFASWTTRFDRRKRENKAKTARWRNVKKKQSRSSIVHPRLSFSPCPLTTHDRGPVLVPCRVHVVDRCTDRKSGRVY